MATALDAKMLPKVLAVIDKFGTNAVFFLPGTKTYEAETRETIESTPTETTRKISPPVAYTGGLAPGEVTEREDEQAYVAASGLTFTPTKDYKMTFGGISYTIRWVTPIYSGDNIAAYELVLRRSEGRKW